MLDTIDEQLINILEKNADQTSEKLASQLNVSASTVRRRLKNLQQKGIIRTVATFDPNKAGFPIVVILAFDVTRTKTAQAVERLAKATEVKWVASTTGRYSIIAFARFRSTDDLDNFMQVQTPNMEGLKDSETAIFLHSVNGK